MVGDYITIDDLREVSLRAHWRFGPSSTGEWIKVSWSQFGLYVVNPRAGGHHSCGWK
jgi:hypothetical protein